MFDVMVAVSTSQSPKGAFFPDNDTVWYIGLKLILQFCIAVLEKSYGTNETIWLELSSGYLT